jgi:hypothetical protein
MGAGKMAAADMDEWLRKDGKWNYSLKPNIYNL